MSPGFLLITVNDQINGVLIYISTLTPGTYAGRRGYSVIYDTCLPNGQRSISGLVIQSVVLNSDCYHWEGERPAKLSTANIATCAVLIGNLISDIFSLA